MIYIAITLIVASAVFIIGYIAIKKPTYTVNQPKKVKIKEIEISVEIADTMLKRAQGLMFRESLPENSGMLFIFQKKGVYPFWMANTKIPLDIIWIDENLKIVYISENTPSCKKSGVAQSLCTQYNPKVPALYVLEINANWCKKNRVGVGDSVLQIY
jgi:uncharacterized membrane protein (UPF0127 family)